MIMIGEAAMDKRRWYTVGAKYFACIFCGHTKIIQVNSKDTEKTRVLNCPVCGIKTTFRELELGLVDAISEETQKQIQLQGQTFLTYRPKKKHIVRSANKQTHKTYEARQKEKLFDLMLTAALMTQHGTRPQTFRVFVQAIELLPEKRKRYYEYRFRHAFNKNRETPFAPYNPNDPIHKKASATSCQTATAALLAMNSERRSTRQSARDLLHNLVEELAPNISAEDYLQLTKSFNAVLLAASQNKKYKNAKKKKGKS